MATKSADWNPSSWRAFPAKQQAEYKDPELLQEVLDQIKYFPKLIVKEEIDTLRRQLADAAEGKRFLLQGGDCAERFLDCKSTLIENKVKILLQMSLVLTWGARMPAIRVGRMAGQFAKPRSKPTEMVEGQEIPCFRGDNVNGFDPANRDPDPKRLTQAYFHSAATLNYIRALLNGQFASLHTPDRWNMEWMNGSGDRTPTPNVGRYTKMVSKLKEAMRFMDACGVDSSKLDYADMFTSHEGLHLPYEEALTDSTAYNYGAHFLWIGDRTRQLDGAHVEFFRGLRNPVGVKVGPTTDPDELVNLVKRLWPDPEGDPGKITLITRFGADKVEEYLPRVISAIQAAGLKVVWSCDPCHGNTRSTEAGVKTRSFESIVSELRRTFVVHERAGSRLMGVHLELTGEDVTECTGGMQDLQDGDLHVRYTSYCDPRLNYAQSMEIALLCAEFLSDHADHHEANGL